MSSFSIRSGLFAPLRLPVVSPSWFGWILVVLLVAVPGLAALKLAALVGTFLMGFWRQDFRRLGLYVGASVLLSLGVAFATGVANDVTAADRLNQWVRIVSFYGVFAALYYVRDSFSTARQLDRACLSIAILMAAVKIGIWCAVVLLGYSLADVMEFFGFETVTLLIGFNIFRLQFPSDFVCLFLLACYSGRRSAWQDLAFALSVSVVIFLSFSRFVFLCFFVGLAVRALWLKRVDLIAGFGVLILCVALLLFGNELVQRFVGEGSTASDETRVEQTEALAADIALHPWFGRGVGGSVPDFLRSESLPFSYEAQWHATVMQLGWVGTLWLIGNVLAIVFVGVRRPRAAACLSVLVLLWFLAGFTNPFLTSLGSAVGLAIARQRASLGPAAV